MNEIEKLRMLLPHWIEHNGEHAQEFTEYAELSDTIREQLLAAAGLLAEANSQLSAALDALGGPLEHHHA